MRRAVLTVLTTLTIASGTLALTGPPAQAQTIRFADARGDVSSPNDIVRTVARNGSRIGVVVTHRDLRRSATDIQFGVLTASGVKWHVFAELGGGTAAVYDGDWKVHRCPGLKVARSLAGSQTALSVPRSCLGSPGKVKLQPRVQWSADGSKGDWSVNAGGHWTRWIKR